ncbi:hypothetical protein GCM10028803_42290 [Larkinella knui]|uniref:Lipocalin-like domain-containing protein n=1 Tax=Larkinella knui TaxID=2025310 RepID=A0A3P1CNR3_9BACT|nr:hypothetical protein [Larkinella knui]RRB14858.1 hypothetical protein EHT87_09835 [Larkinella knui]
MKKILVFWFVLGALVACKKDNNDHPTPEQTVEPAAKVAGTYKLSSFHFINGANEVELEKLPVVESGKTVASGTVKFTKKADGKARMNVTLVIEGEGSIPVVEDLEIEVRESGKVFGLYADGERIGDADGDFIIFNISGKSESGDDLLLAFNAKK